MFPAHVYNGMDNATQIKRLKKLMGNKHCDICGGFIIQGYDQVKTINKKKVHIGCLNIKKLKR